MDDRSLEREKIRLLVARYALGVDQRDIDTLIGLYVEDIDTETPNYAVDTSLGRGRAAMRTYFNHALRRFGRSVHFVGTHVIDFDGDEAASGTQYTTAYEERTDPHHWAVMLLAYSDRYVRVDGEWLFGARRQIRTWFTDFIGHPDKAAIARDTEVGYPPFLPGAWPSWERFWSDSAPQ